MPAPVLREVAILEMHGGVLGVCEPGSLYLRAFEVIGMHPLEVGLACHLFSGVAKAVGPSRVHTREVSVEARHAAHLIGDGKPAICLSLEAVPGPNLPPDDQGDRSKGQATGEIAVQAKADLLAPAMPPRVPRVTASSAIGTT